MITGELKNKIDSIWENMWQSSIRRRKRSRQI